MYIVFLLLMATGIFFLNDLYTLTLNRCECNYYRLVEVIMTKVRGQSDLSLSHPTGHATCL